MALTINALRMVDDAAHDTGEKRVGRPPYDPPPAMRQLVEVMAAMGASQEAMCRELVRLDQPCAATETLNRAFADELAHAKERRVMGYAMKVHSIAMGNTPGALGACKFLLSVMGGEQWRVRDADEPPAAAAEDAGAVRIVIPDNGRGFPPGVHPGYVTIDGEPVDEEPESDAA